MKTSFIFVVVTFIVYTPEAQALFNHTAQERSRREHAEQQLSHERQNNEYLVHRNEHLHSTISFLLAGVVTALVVGAAIGSKTRRDHETNGEQ